VPENNAPSTRESALIAVIPAAESLVNAFRGRYDPSAARGVPAHVTILYPFMPPELIDESTLDELRTLFSRFPAFPITFTRTMEFPETLFLAPEPVDPFVRLTRAVVSAFPQYPPYGGVFSQIVPHLTVAQVKEVAQMELIKAEFAEAVPGKLPITTQVNAITLMDETDDKWQIHSVFPLKFA
jgi:2'-5' RNA ligase